MPVEVCKETSPLGSNRKEELDIFDGLPVMTKLELRRVSLEHGGYHTPYLNETLYLHFKGYRRIENLEEYTGLKSLWLHSNGFGTIENISHLHQLRCLFLQRNALTKIENLHGLNSLVQLDLSENAIRMVEGLSHLKQLTTLNLSKNALRDADSINHLRECVTLTSIDLTKNDLAGDGVIECLTSIPKLSSLNMAGNPVVSKVPYFRKKMIVASKTLRYLDRPVFEAERAATEAWATGGLESEREMKDKIHKMKKEEERKAVEEFRAWQYTVRHRDFATRHEIGGIQPESDLERAEKQKAQLDGTGASTSCSGGSCDEFVRENTEAIVESNIGPGVAELVKEEASIEATEEVTTEVAATEEVTMKEESTVEVTMNKEATEQVITEEFTTKEVTTEMITTEAIEVYAESTSPSAANAYPTSRTVTKKVMDAVPKTNNLVSHEKRTVFEDNARLVHERTDLLHEQLIDANDVKSTSSHSMSRDENASEMFDLTTVDDQKIAQNRSKNEAISVTDINQDGDDTSEKRRMKVDESIAIMKTKNGSFKINSGSIGWTKKMDESLLRLAEECNFDFDAVASSMLKEFADHVFDFDASLCYTRWNFLDLDNDEEKEILNDFFRLTQGGEIDRCEIFREPKNVVSVTTSFQDLNETNKTTMGSIGTENSGWTTEMDDFLLKVSKESNYNFDLVASSISQEFSMIITSDIDPFLCYRRWMILSFGNQDEDPNDISFSETDKPLSFFTNEDGTRKTLDKLERDTIFATSLELETPPGYLEADSDEEESVSGTKHDVISIEHLRKMGRKTHESDGVTAASLSDEILPKEHSSTLDGSIANNAAMTSSSVADAIPSSPSSDEDSFKTACESPLFGE